MLEEEQPVRPLTLLSAPRALSAAVVGVLALLPAAALWLHRRAFTAPARATWRGSATLLAGLALLSGAATVLHALPTGHRRCLALAHVAHAADVNGRRRGLRSISAHRGGDW